MSIKSKEELDKWALEFHNICSKNGISELYTGDPEDYLDYFNDGESPDEAFSTELSYCGD